MIILAPGLFDHALDHGRRSKQRHLAHVLGQPEQLGGIEAMGGRHHMAGAAAHMDEVVQAGAVGHGRGIQRRIVGAHLIDIRGVAQRHGDQVAVGQHHALGAPGGARGIEQPGEVVILAGHRLFQAGPTMAGRQRVAVQFRAMRGQIPR